MTLFVRPRYEPTRWISVFGDETSSVSDKLRAKYKRDLAKREEVFGCCNDKDET